MSYDPGLDGCYKCRKVTEGIWQGRGKNRYFTCLRCFCTMVRRLVRGRNKPSGMTPRNEWL